MITVLFNNGNVMEFPGGETWQHVQSKVRILDENDRVIGVLANGFDAIRWTPEPVDMAQVERDLREVKDGLE